MADQLVFTSIEGRDVIAKKRGKHYVQQRGYAHFPGTGPDGETCGSCAHIVPFRTMRRWYKCGKARSKWTGGKGSDVLVRSPACKYWEKPT